MLLETRIIAALENYTELLSIYNLSTTPFLFLSKTESGGNATTLQDYVITNEADKTVSDLATLA